MACLDGLMIGLKHLITFLIQLRLTNDQLVLTMYKPVIMFQNAPPS